MPIKGFQGTSLLDYPGKIASLVFFAGCNLTCPFCHNPELLGSAGQLPDYPIDELVAELQRRRRFIDGVVVTGGEPTLAAELEPLLRRIKALGLLVKLDTNGLAPRMLERLIGAGLVDYIALDLKTALPRYGELDSRPVDPDALEQSLGLLRKGTVDSELRTTCVPGFVTEQDLHQLGTSIRGARHWVLQQFVPDHALGESCRTLTPYSTERIRQLAGIAAGYVERVSLRGLRDGG